MKKIIKFAIIGILLIVLGSCECGAPTKYKHFTIVKVTYTDGSTDKLTNTFINRSSKVKIRLDSESACVRLMGSRRPSWETIACDIRKYEVISLSTKEVKTKR